MRKEQERQILEKPRKNSDDNIEEDNNHVSDENYFYDDEDEYDEEEDDDLKIKSEKDGHEVVDHQGKQITQCFRFFSGL